MTGLTFVAAPSWQGAFPGAIVAAFTVRGTHNSTTNDALDKAKRGLEQELRDRWEGKTRADVRADPVLAVYDAYYKKYGQNYHVQMQIESIALKGKTIPSRAALVEAMFMAELTTGLLTAVQDIDRLSGPVEVIATTGEETYIRYDGVDETCKPGDMAIRDDVGILTSIVQGPTKHALATPETRNALFCVYAPAGIGETAVLHHFDLIEAYIGLISPDAEIVERVLLKA